MNHVNCVFISNGSSVSSIVSSHNVCKVEQNDNEPLNLKFCFASYGHKKAIVHFIKFDCGMYFCFGICLVLSMAAVRNCTMTKACTKFAFFKTSHFQSDDFDRSPRVFTINAADACGYLRAYGLLSFIRNI